MTRRFLVTAAWAIFSMVGVASCVQFPTEERAVADMRPQISFQAERSVHDARVFVDDLEMGQVGQFIEGWAALRVLSGSHRVRVMKGESILLDERVYLGDGVHRTFIVK